MISVTAVLLSATVLFAMALSLILSPTASKRISTAAMAIAVIGGLLYYGIGFTQIPGGSLGLSLLRTPMCVIRMFIGVNELAALKGFSWVESRAGLYVFWLVHVLAFYSMASAVMFSLGAAALRQLRMLLAKRGDLTLIYGINEQSVSLGKECRGARKQAVVFVAESADENTVRDLNSAGMTVMTGADAVSSEKSVLKKLKLKKRKLTVYALDETEDRNLFYALQLKDALEKAGVPAERTRLTLPGAEDILMPMLQVSEKNYGFGYVYVFDPADVTARAMIRTCPPWDFMYFDKAGRSTGDFECVVAGFGRHGQAVLKALVMNGQFEGSTFRAAVFSPTVWNESGYLMVESPEIWKNYDIRCFAEDARSRAFYEYIDNRLSTLKMIVICTGSDEMNSEVSDGLMLFLKRRHAEQICVVQCGTNGVRYQETVGNPIVRTDIYTQALLSAEETDRRAILLNSTYDSSDKSNWEKWVSCDSFSKMSSRASADFAPAFIRISGSSEEEILSGNWKPDAAMQEVLGKTEHLRWCAFHYVMGYTGMSREEFDANAAAYVRLRAEGKPPIKIAKNAHERTHACLVPWEELDELSERENRVTGKNVDYKQIDINNVLAMPRLLQSELEKGRKRKKERT
ncbi:MAG: hypothetical protein IJV40_09560 [Oscillospiraceae bacterium]|nr:hypothetical protein [Oscillospiraceae bacterium]